MVPALKAWETLNEQLLGNRAREVVGGLRLPQPKKFLGLVPRIFFLPLHFSPSAEEFFWR